MHGIPANKVFSTVRPAALSTLGVAVTPAVGSKGSWVQTASAANMGRDAVGITVSVSSGTTSATVRAIALDIGVDPAGGTAYTTVISNVLCGNATGSGAAGGYSLYFPIRINAGSTVAVRAQGTTTATTTVLVTFSQGESCPGTVWSGSFSETIGTMSGALGVSYTPGNVAKGSWALLGTTTRNLKYWQASAQLNNTVVAANFQYIDLAYGDGTTYVPIFNDLVVSFPTANEDAAQFLFPTCQHFCDVPAGSNIYIRAASTSAPATGYNALAIGIGG